MLLKGLFCLKMYALKHGPGNSYCRGLTAIAVFVYIFNYLPGRAYRNELISDFRLSLENIFKKLISHADIE
jgi:hypothetical protein